MDAGVGMADRDQGPPKQTPSPLKASSMGGQPDTDLLLWVPGGGVCSLSSACDHNCLPIDGGLGCITQAEKLALHVVQVRGHELEHVILSVKILGWALASGPAVSQHPCQPSGSPLLHCLSVAAWPGSGLGLFVVPSSPMTHSPGPADHSQFYT